MPKKEKTPGQVVADAVVKHLSDPDAEKKELEAQREKEARMRAALMGQGLIKKGGGK